MIKSNFAAANRGIGAEHPQHHTRCSKCPLSDKQDRLLTSKEAASRLNISEKTLRKDRSTGHLGIPYVSFGGVIRYSTASMDAWIYDHMIYADQLSRRGRPPKLVVVAREFEDKERVAQVLGKSKRSR